MIRTIRSRRPPAFACPWRIAWGAALLAASLSVAVPARAGDDAPAPTPAAAQDPAATLIKERERTRSELQDLKKAITLSKGKIADLEDRIAGLTKDRTTIRAQLVDAAQKQKSLQQKLDDDAKRLTALHVREDAIHKNLNAHRDVLADVLGALERMGRHPPPALLVTPNDALASVRSAILLGAVVPKMRQQTLALVGQLDDLAKVRKKIAGEKAGMTATLTDVAVQKKRLSLLMQKKNSLRSQSEASLAEEQRQSEDLAGKADSLNGLIASLEGRIDAAQKAQQEMRLAEEKRRQQTAEELQAARKRVTDGLPDKNRIAPAYEFSELKHKLDLPVAGDPVKWFGDDDGTGHPMQGMTVAADPGAVVTAPSDAWVVYAGPFRSYGKLLIFNVGDGYHIVMAGLGKIDVAQGQFVVAGEPVAEMGETKLAGATALALVSDQPTLYIEFRKSGKPIDSRPWWSGKFSGRVSNGT